MAPPGHPGDDWSRMCPRRPDKPAIPLNGDRSIFAAWPPEAVCEICHVRPESDAGYVGPVKGEAVTFPAPETRFTCDGCCRKILGLEPDELTEHMCGLYCTDQLHVEVIIMMRGELEPLSAEQRVGRLADDYGARGWSVASVEPPAPHMDVPPVTGSRWAVTIYPMRPFLRVR